MASRSAGVSFAARLDGPDLVAALRGAGAEGRCERSRLNIHAVRDSKSHERSATAVAGKTGSIGAGGGEEPTISLVM